LKSKKGIKTCAFYFFKKIIFFEKKRRTSFKENENSFVQILM